MNYNELRGKTVLITGATGLIGCAVTQQIYRNLDGDVKIIAVIRNKAKAQQLFGSDTESGIQFVICDICDPEFVSKVSAQIKGNVDYIIHTASQTASKAFVEKPVETIQTALTGTENILQLAKNYHVESLVYLSSMEVYGSPSTDEKIAEDHPTNLDAMSVRSCYPESKRMCESLCASYASEFGVPAKVVRLTQTFGPGVAYNDGRVFAEFARCAIERRNIVLNTKGETKRNYLYIDDAVDAIVTVLLRGENGEAYNAANEATYCSIYEMAELVARECANNEISVTFNENVEGKNFGYAPVLHMNLDTSKLSSLGWCAHTDLAAMFRNMIEDMKK